MSTVKKEARLSGILLARKGSALPAYTDHRLTFQATDQFIEASQERIIPKELINDDISNIDHLDKHELSNAINELKTIHKKQTSNSLNMPKSNSVEQVAKPTNGFQNRSHKNTSYIAHSDNSAKNKNVEAKRIAMTLRMEQEDHLKLRLFAAHSRKSCQEIISEALELYLSKSEKVCLMEDCNCLSS